MKKILLSKSVYKEHKSYKCTYEPVVLIKKKRISEWEKSFRIAKAYHDHYHNIAVPMDFKTNDGINRSEYGLGLRCWLLDQIKKLKAGKLTPDQEELFKTIYKGGSLRDSKNISTKEIIPSKENDEMLLRSTGIQVAKISDTLENTEFEDDGCVIDKNKFMQYKKALK